MTERVSSNTVNILTIKGDSTSKLVRSRSFLFLTLVRSCVVIITIIIIVADEDRTITYPVVFVHECPHTVV